MTEKACKTCHLVITEGPTCPTCGTSELSDRWDSYILVFDPEKSELGKKLDAKVAGKYAVRIK